MCLFGTLGEKKKLYFSDTHFLGWCISAGLSRGNKIFQLASRESSQHAASVRPVPCWHGVPGAVTAQNKSSHSGAEVICVSQGWGTGFRVALVSLSP